MGWKFKDMNSLMVAFYPNAKKCIDDEKRYFECFLITKCSWESASYSHGEVKVIKESMLNNMVSGMKESIMGETVI